MQIAELAGLDLDDWQVFCLIVALARKDGVWAAFEVALVIARQNGKSEVLVAVILWALFTELEDPRLVIFAAHEYKTAREIFLRLRLQLQPPSDSDPLLHADSVLTEQVKSIRTANGEESVELRNGRRVRFLARTSGSGRGFSGDIVLLDEAYKLNQEQMAALLPTMGARPNPQIWYASMGPFEDSEVQLQVMERGRSGAPKLCYLSWEADPSASVEDRAVWARCNPAHPHRMPLETLENEFRALGEHGFAREKLCMTVTVSASPIQGHMWEKVQDPAAVPAEGMVFGVDVNPERTQRSVAVADANGNVELVDYGPLSGLTERLIGLHAEHGAPVALDMASHAATYVPELEAAGVVLVKYSGSDMAAAAGRFLDMVADEELRVRSHPALSAAVRGAAQRPLGDGAWAWGRRKSHIDISPLVAATLAVDSAVKPKVEDPGLVVYDLADY